MSGYTEPDASGRDRLFRNVMAGWGAHGVTAVVGFAMPRIIYESIGQTALGIWDIGWSLLQYIAFSGLGASSAVVHYVAKYRAEGSSAGVRDTTATAWYCQLLLALSVAALFVGLFASLHFWLPGLDGFSLSDLLAVGLLLGGTIVAGMLGGVAHGILAGCHRGSWNEYLTIGSDIVLALAMVGVLLAGWGIVGLAAATLGTRLIIEVLRLALAASVCAAMSLRIRDANRERLRSIVLYGIKTSIGVAQDLMVHQVARLALAAAAGPVAVAAYSRYATLIRQIMRSVDRVTQVIVPMTSGLVGLGREDDVQLFSLKASNAAVMMVLPMTIVFGVFGDDLVQLWMGPEFVVPGLAWVFAIMAAVHGDRGVTNQLLSGLNSHGRIALVCMGASLAVLVTTLLLLEPLSPLGAGIVVACSTILGVSVPNFLLACRRLGIEYWRHIRVVYSKPLLCNAFLLAGLLGARHGFHTGEHTLGVLSAAAGLAVLALLYWAFAFDAGLRDRVRRRIGILRTT